MATAPRTDAAHATLARMHARIDDELRSELDRRRVSLAALAAPAAALIDEMRRLLDAGGSRIRPLLCWLAFRAAGGPEGEPIVRAAASLELLHTFALIHDDLIDDAAERRGAASSAVALEAARPADAAAGFGRAAALLTGDLAFAIATSMLRTAGFPAERTAAAFAVHEDMTAAMAAGQVVGLLDGAATIEDAARLRGGVYSVEAPLAIGAVLAGADAPTRERLVSFGRDLGIAFQLRDDLVDGDAAAGVGEGDVDARVDVALAHLPAGIDTEVEACLRTIADGIRVRG